MKTKETYGLTRIDENLLRLENAEQVDVRVYANEQVQIEAAAVEELKGLLGLQATLERFHAADAEAFSQRPRIERVSLTPDFHKARGIPVGTVLETSGFVVPQAIGNDINCGMRLHKTSLEVGQVRAQLDELENASRHIYFEGGRRIPTLYDHREGLLLGGVGGLFDTVEGDFDEGLWSYFHRTSRTDTLARIDRSGSLRAGSVRKFADYLGKPGQIQRDSQIGSIGGGNHFVEFQEVKRIIDGTIAHAWGLREGMVTVMVHTGSVGIGHSAGSYYQNQVRQIYPQATRFPDNNIFILPITEKYQASAAIFWDAMHSAANFAYVNRMFLALMAWSSLESVCGEIKFDLLYDAPHNMIWPSERDGRATVIHRKGACPARGFEAMADTPFAYYGEPVLVPGSMGASSYVLAGSGFDGSNQSAAHGAGRALSRGSSMKGFDKEFEDFLNRFRVVTPVDLRRQDIRARRDIIDKKLAELRQEAPFAYKGIGPVVQTITDSGMARPVAELVPIMTVKG